MSKLNRIIKFISVTHSCPSFPVFGLQTAVDVLVTGTYPRLPQCIQDKIIPSLTLKDKEKEDTIDRLGDLVPNFTTCFRHRFLSELYTNLVIDH